MAIQPAEIDGKHAQRTVFVDTFVTDGLLGPEVQMLGAVNDGGQVVWSSAPCCWGPMITPSIKGGHEVTRPVAVAGAEVGDAVAIRIKSLEITSLATASGTDEAIEGRYSGDDPFATPVCPGCGTEWPETHLEGIGTESVRCLKCGADASVFRVANGYTIAFDELRTVGVTVPKEAAEAFAREPQHYAALPDNSAQNPILAYAPHDIVALATRVRPFLGQIGTTPSMTIMSAYNAGDLGSWLVGATHPYALTADELARHKTDGHLDIDAIRAGAILVCPVKVPGAGVYIGDMHAVQGDGEIALHTCDVSGTANLQVEVVKGLGIDGPVLFPLEEDLPFLAKPLLPEERMRAEVLGRRFGVERLERSLPISVIGTGANLNVATDNGIARAVQLLDLSTDEVRNRATISGAIEIGRHPGVVQVTFRAPVDRLEACGLLCYAVEQYGSPE